MGVTNFLYGAMVLINEKYSSTKKFLAYPRVSQEQKSNMSHISQAMASKYISLWQYCPQSTGGKLKPLICFTTMTFEDYKMPRWLVCTTPPWVEHTNCLDKKWGCALKICFLSITKVGNKQWPYAWTNENFNNGLVSMIFTWMIYSYAVYV